MAGDAFERALAALRRKERTAAELARWFAERDYAADEAEEALARLIELGELDDERFARRFAEDKRELSGWGAGRIRESLLGRGIEPATVDAIVGEDSPGEQIARAVELLSRRGAGLGDDRARASALAYLTRRGYDYEIAYEAVRRSQRRAA